MARAKSQPITGQNHLFTDPRSQENSSGVIKTWQDIEASPEARLEALVGDSVGPHIRISERAERLISAMNALAHRNMLKGFDEAVVSPKHKRPIWERYIDGTPIVIDRSQNKSDQLLDEAWGDFLRSTGFAALKGTGLVTRGQVRTKRDRFWGEFTHSVGHPKAHNELLKLRQKQRHFLPDNHPYQNVKGWRDERDRKIKAERSSAVTSDVPEGTLPVRTPEIDAAYLPFARRIADSVERQIEVHGQEEARRREVENDRVLQTLKKTNP